MYEIIELGEEIKNSFKDTDPAVGCWWPDIILARADFPIPDGPVQSTLWPKLKERFNLEYKRMPPSSKVTFSILSMLILWQNISPSTNSFFNGDEHGVKKEANQTYKKNIEHD